MLDLWAPSRRGLILAGVLATVLSLYNMGSVEFWGEDEAQPLYFVARTLIGLQTGSLTDLGAILISSHPPMRMLVEIPFVLIGGVTEFSARFPNFLSSLVILYILYRLFQPILDRSALRIGCMVKIEEIVQ